MSPSAKEPAVVSSLDTDLKVGELFAQARTESGESLAQVEKVTKIRKRYLESIEKGEYDQLADDVYSLGYVKSYADYLGFETTPIVNMYKKERLIFSQANGGASKEIPQKLGLRPVDSTGFIISAKTLLIGFAVIIFLLVGTYLLTQVLLLAAPPKLTLNSTTEKVTTNFAIISGETDIGADIFINGSPVATNLDGSFSEQVSLIDGVNQIELTAKNKLGKSKIVYKTITAELQSASKPTAQLSQSVVDGVELRVSIKNQATWVVIVADGQDLFRGTMLPDSQQVFKARSLIKLTTGNAGNTSVALSNANVAAKDLSTLGKPGETKIDLEFQRDTGFGN